MRHAALVYYIATMIGAKGISPADFSMARRPPHEAPDLDHESKLDGLLGGLIQRDVGCTCGSGDEALIHEESCARMKGPPEARK